MFLSIEKCFVRKSFWIQIDGGLEFIKKNPSILLNWTELDALFKHDGVFSRTGGVVYLEIQNSLTTAWVLNVLVHTCSSL